MAGVHHSQRSLRTQFLAGLNGPIWDQLEVHSIRDINVLVHKAQLIHDQLQRRKKDSWSTPQLRRYNPNSSQSTSTSFSPNSSMQPKGVSNSPNTGYQVQQRRVAAPPSTDRAPPSKDRARDIQCFKCLGKGHIAKDCPNQRKILLNTIGGYESEEDQPEEPIGQGEMDKSGKEQVRC